MWALGAPPHPKSSETQIPTEQTEGRVRRRRPQEQKKNQEGSTKQKRESLRNQTKKKNRKEKERGNVSLRSLGPLPGASCRMFAHHEDENNKELQWCLALMFTFGSLWLRLVCCCFRSLMVCTVVSVSSHFLLSLCYAWLPSGHVALVATKESIDYHCPRNLYILYSPRIFLGIRSASYTQLICPRIFPGMAL